MPVNSERISVPEVAGILHPQKHLPPKKLTEFFNMPEEVPIPGPVAGDCRACHKVDPKDWRTLLQKLQSAGMIDFVPWEDAVRDGAGYKGWIILCSPQTRVR